MLARSPSARGLPRALAVSLFVAGAAACADAGPGSSPGGVAVTPALGPALDEARASGPADDATMKSVNVRSRRLPCAELALCAAGCDPRDAGCARTCVAAASAGAIATLRPLLACAVLGGCAPGDTECAEDRCATEVAACIHHRAGAR
jgi:hypothetical protein